MDAIIIFNKKKESKMKIKASIFAILLIVFCVLGVKAKDIVTTINLDADDIAVDDSSNKIYAVKSSDQKVQVVDGASDTASSNISLSATVSPVISVNSNTGLIYIKSRSSGTQGVSVINGKTGADTGIFIPIAGNIEDIEVDSFKNRIYVIGILGKEGKVNLIDGDTNMIVDTLSISENANQLSEIAICSKDKAVTIDGPSGTVYILKADNANKLSIEGTVIVENQDAGNSKIACNSATNKAYTAGTNTNDDIVHVINVSTQMLIESIPIDAIAFSNGGNSISDIAVDSTKNKVYIAQNDNLTDSIVVLDGNSNEFDESTEFSSNVTFSGIKVNAETNKVYVLDGSKNTLTVINGSLNESSPSSGTSTSSTSSSSTSSSSGGGQVSVDNVRDEGNSFLEVLDLFLSLKDKLDSQSKITKVKQLNRKLKASLPQLKKLEKKVNALLELESILLGDSSLSNEAKQCLATLKSATKISESVIGKIESLSCSVGIPKCIAEDVVDEIISTGESILRKTEASSTDKDNNGFPDLCDYVSIMRGNKGK